MEKFCAVAASALLVWGASSLPAEVFTIGNPGAEPRSAVGVQITTCDFADGTSAYSFNICWDTNVLQYQSASMDLSFGEGTNVTGVEPSHQATTWIGGSVTVVPAALTVGGPASQSVCLGQSVTFSVSAVGTPPYLYQWYTNGAPVLGATNASYAIPVATREDALITYEVAVMDLYEIALSDAAVLTVSTPPEIVIPPADQVPEGSSVEFSVEAVGGDLLWYQWRANGEPIAGATDMYYTITNVTSAHALNTYDVVVTNGCGAVTSAPVTIRLPHPFYPGGGLPGLFGGMDLFTTNAAGLQLHVWSSAATEPAVTDWTLEGPMSEQPLGDGSGNSRYSLNVIPITSPVFYLIGTTTAGPYPQTVPLHFFTTDPDGNDTLSRAEVAISADGYLGAPVVSLSISLGSSLLLSAHTIPGLSYVVEMATNLSPPISWLPLDTNTVSPNGQIRFTSPPANSQQYFQLRFP